jgi:hypothetical protein
LVTAYALSPVEISRDALVLGPIKGFPEQPTEEAEQALTSDTTDVPKEGA